MWRTKSSVFRQNDRRLCGPRTMIRENGRMKVMIMYSSEIQDGDRRWPTVTTFVAISKLQRVKPQDLKGALECVHTWLPKNGLKLWISEWYLWISVDHPGSPFQRSPVSRCRESWSKVCGGAGGRLCAFCGADSSGCGGMSRWTAMWRIWEDLYVFNGNTVSQHTLAISFLYKKIQKLVLLDCVGFEYSTLDMPSLWS
jgi:hypothetical protein